jgi:uncharacterized protein (UPF0371 family)
VAYEAATADLRDFNMIDPFHLEAYKKTSINYNRDVEVFPVLKRILEKIMGSEEVYKSPTDMGVNRAGFGIVNDEVVREAARQEIIRRYYRSACDYALGFVDKETVERSALIVEEVALRPQDRVVVEPALEAAREAEEAGKGSGNIFCGAALQLGSGRIVTGKNSDLMHASSSLILNAIKVLAGIPDNIHLLSPATVESITNMKKSISGAKTINLDLEETLIALSISAANNPTTQAAMGMLKELRGCEVHLSHMPTPGDEAGLRRLGVNLTCEPVFATKSLFIA